MSSIELPAVWRSGRVSSAGFAQGAEILYGLLDQRTLVLYDAVERKELPSWTFTRDAAVEVSASERARAYFFC